MNFLEIILFTVSVVNIECENSLHLFELRLFNNAGIESIIFLAFIFSPITPVEKTRISSIEQLALLANDWQYLTASLYPSFPVPALAFPAFTIRNCGLLFFRFCWLIITAGDLALLFVNTPATLAFGLISMIDRSSLVFLYIPEETEDTLIPSTGCIFLVVLSFIIIFTLFDYIK